MSSSKTGEVDLDKYFRLESNQFNQEEEIKRILKLMNEGNKDPLLVLEMPTDCYLTLQISDKIVKKQFRVKSLLVHPDKNPSEDARVVFDELQRANNEIADEEQIRLVRSFMKSARDNVLYNMGLKKSGLPGSLDKKLDYQEILLEHPKIGRMIQLEFMRMSQELKYRDNIRLKNELGRELQEGLRMEKEQKEKREYEKELEGSREARIKSWRTFSKNNVVGGVGGVAKKKKKKVVLPGAI